VEKVEGRGDLPLKIEWAGKKPARCEDTMARNLRQTFHESHLYHGTPEEFSPGDIIKPAEQVGKRASNDASLAYATPDIHTANFMSWEQNNFNGENWRDDVEKNPPRRNVYRVEPVDPSDLTRKNGVMSTAIRLNGAGTVSDEVMSPSGFRVLSKVQYPEEIINKIFEMNRNDPKRKGYRGYGTMTNASWPSNVSLRYPSLEKDEYNPRHHEGIKRLERSSAVERARRKRRK